MKFIHWASYFIVLFAVGLSLYIFYLLFIPLKPVEFLNTPFPVKTPIVKQGENLIYTVSDCKYVDSKAVVSRTFVDTIQYTLAEIYPSVPKGCHTKDIMSVKVPQAVPPGTYHLQITVTYHLNPFRTYTVTASTSAFQIVE